MTYSNWKIPKKVFQTWKNKTFPPEYEAEREKMRQENYEFVFFLFDDFEMSDYVHKNFPGIISDCYDKLNIMTAKVDLWRYLIIYKEGGVYLDIDSLINRPLRELITPEDSAIITAEGNPGLLVQWALFFEKEHPILKKTIEIVINNILHNTYPNDIIKMTGPRAFARAVEEICLIHFPSLTPQFSAYNVSPLTHQTFQNSEISFRILGVDFNGHLGFKTPLYEQQIMGIHWITEIRGGKQLLKP